MGQRVMQSAFGLLAQGRRIDHPIAAHVRLLENIRNALVDACEHGGIRQ